MHKNDFRLTSNFALVNANVRTKLIEKQKKTNFWKVKLLLYINKDNRLLLWLFNLKHSSVSFRPNKWMHLRVSGFSPVQSKAFSLMFKLKAKHKFKW